MECVYICVYIVVTNTEAIEPGGYLQWDEPDPKNHYDVIAPKPENETGNLAAVFQKVADLEDWRYITFTPSPPPPHLL